MAFTKTSDVLTFMLAGNSRITVTSRKTGKWFTYKVNQKDNDFGRKTPHFVSVLIGPDNNTDYMYIGFISSTGDFMAGRKGKPDAESYKSFEWMYNMMRNRDEIHPMLEVRHEGRCGRCNRVLTVPESIDNGIGPECIKHI